MALTYPSLLPDLSRELAPVDSSFQQSFADTVSDYGTDADGFDQLFLEVTTEVVSLDNLLSSFDVPLALAAVPSSATDDPTFQDYTDALTDAGNTIGPQVQQFVVDATGATPPPPSGAPTGGGTNTPPTQSAKCGTYGQSQVLLSDNTQNCFAADALPVVNIADGKCTFIFPMDNSTFAGRANVSATSLAQGDAGLWAISHDTIPGASGGPAISRVWFTLTPYKVGHFDARFNVTTDRAATPEVWCMIVDVINQGAPASGGTPTPPAQPPSGQPPTRGPVVL